VVVQVNGKVRSRVQVPFGTAQKEVERLARADAKVHAFLEGRQVVKVVFVPDRLLNIVVK
jgi:leucyl-tRNA synthetase